MRRVSEVLLLDSIRMNQFSRFVLHYSNKNPSKNSGKKKREQFDVIIMDALDPDKFIEIVGSLYKDDQFVKSIFHGLTDEGVVSSILCTRTVLLAIIQK